MRVSVIVPVYNVQNYIRECILSILNQTFRDFEIIIINDGSKDKSIEHIKDLVNDNENIILINQENGGLSNARNTGLRIATGEYISFVDSDDYIGKNFLATLYSEAKEFDLDIACGNYIKFDENKKNPIRERDEKLYTKTAVTGVQFLYDQLEVRNYKMEVWDDLYKKTFLDNNNLTFLEGLMHEDDLFTPLALLAAQRVKLVRNHDYFYRQRATSITGIGNEEKSIKNVIVIINFLKEKYLAEENSFKKKTLAKIIYYLSVRVVLLILKGKFKQKKELYKLLNVKITEREYDFNPTFESKLRFFLLKNVPSIYGTIVNTKRKNKRKLKKNKVECEIGYEV